MQAHARGRLMWRGKSVSNKTGANGISGRWLYNQNRDKREITGNPALVNGAVMKDGRCQQREPVLALWGKDGSRVPGRRAVPGCWAAAIVYGTDGTESWQGRGSLAELIRQ